MLALPEVTTRRTVSDARAFSIPDSTLFLKKTTFRQAPALALRTRLMSAMTTQRHLGLPLPVVVIRGGDENYWRTILGQHVAKRGIGGKHVLQRTPDVNHWVESSSSSSSMLPGIASGSPEGVVRCRQQAHGV